MRMYDILCHKRDGRALTAEEIAWFIREYTRESIPDYQAAALLMAVVLNGMSEEETAVLTREMARSGEMLDLSGLGGGTADKHSTGGVGDKTTLIAAPLAAALGCTVAKLSGRGLGHTGGTIDKLESIPGLRTELTPAQFLRQAATVGVCIAGQTGNLAPADKKLYALRDVTATVDSIPLIASSIMSKKLASGAKCIVLDVKAGSGAFMKTPEQARTLADEMVRIGTRAGRRMAAVITNMDVPLGQAVGNALEVAEAIDTLRGGGDAELRKLCLELAAQMAALVCEIPLSEARGRAVRALDSGAALEKLRALITAQGGDARVIDQPALLPQATLHRAVCSDTEGYLAAMDAGRIGAAAVLLGAGREKKGDQIDPAAGLLLRVKPGGQIRCGDLLATLYANTEDRLRRAEAAFRAALRFSSEPPVQAPLFYAYPQLRQTIPHARARDSSEHTAGAGTV